MKRVSPPDRADGLTLVEVLVAMAVLGIVSAALVALQVGSLRATRNAQQVRELAAAAEHQLGFARLLPAMAACRDLDAWPTVAACEVVITCLEPPCLRRSVTVRVESIGGRSSELRTAAFVPLEQAPVPGAAEQDAVTAPPLRADTVTGGTASGSEGEQP